MTKLRPTRTATHIATLVDYSRDRRFVFAFCPLCDHAEESPIFADDVAAAKDSSIAIIRRHLRHKHRVVAFPVEIKFTVKQEAQNTD
jgi:hypothetical protein